MKEKFGTEGPKEAIDKVGYYYLKVMFEPDLADEEWKILKNGKLKKWDLCQKCGVHSVVIDGKSIFMLVDCWVLRTMLLCTTMLLVTINPAASVSTLLLDKSAAVNKAAEIYNAANEDKDAYALYNYRKYILYILYV